jgi:putative resolvase
LEPQRQFVEPQAGKPVDRVISDLGSGLNYKKTGFKRLLRLILQGNVKELILTHEDRRLRFGSEIIFQICRFFDVKITLLKAEPDKPVMEQVLYRLGRNYDRLLFQNLGPPQPRKP